MSSMHHQLSKVHELEKKAEVTLGSKPYCSNKTLSKTEFAADLKDGELICRGVLTNDDTLHVRSCHHFGSVRRGSISKAEEIGQLW